jgi:hypothetical protein
MVRNALTLAGILAASLAATGAWLGQVVWVVGWPGLAWVALIQGPETLPSCLLVAMAMVLPWRDRLWGRPWHGLALVAALTGVGFGVYQAAAPLVAAPFAPRSFMFLSPDQVAHVLGVSLASLVVMGAGFAVIAWSLLRWLAGPVRWWGLVVLSSALALVVPVAWATAEAIPALNGHQDLVHAVKMGYPPGCTALLLGLASWWARPREQPPVPGSRLPVACTRGRRDPKGVR